MMCRGLDVSRSGYYAQRRRSPSATAVRRQQLVETIRQVHGADDEAEEDDEEGDDAPAKNGLLEKKKKKLLDAKTWERDGKLVVVATALQKELGSEVFEDHNPFLDGNGRVGRLLIAFLLCEQKVLFKPVLYLSHYFKRYRTQYYEHLQASGIGARGRSG